MAKTEAEIKEIFDRLNHPDSPTRQLADWYRRDGEGPVPQCVKDVIAVSRKFRRQQGAIQLPDGD